MTKMLTRAPGTLAQIVLLVLFALFALVTLMVLYHGFVPLDRTVDPATGAVSTTWKVLFGNDEYAAQLAIADALGMADGDARPILYLMMASAFTLIAAMFWMLLRFVRSVATGDPFTLANERRLRRAGWLAFLPIALVTLIVLAKGGSLSFDDLVVILFGILPGVILLAIASVFAQGVAMRADLEGTV